MAREAGRTSGGRLLNPGVEVEIDSGDPSAGYPDDSWSQP
jgi:hypothetical protein